MLRHPAVLNYSAMVMQFRYSSVDISLGIAIQLSYFILLIFQTKASQPSRFWWAFLPPPATLTSKAWTSKMHATAELPPYSPPSIGSRAPPGMAGATRAGWLDGNSRSWWDSDEVQLNPTIANFCNSKKEKEKSWGREMGKKIGVRMDGVRTVEVAYDIKWLLWETEEKLISITLLLLLLLTTRRLEAWIHYTGCLVWNPPILFHVFIEQYSNDQQTFDNHAIIFQGIDWSVNKDETVNSGKKSKPQGKRKENREKPSGLPSGGLFGQATELGRLNTKFPNPPVQQTMDLPFTKNRDSFRIYHFITISRDSSKLCLVFRFLSFSICIYVYNNDNTF